MFRNLGARVRGPELVPTVLLLVLATGGVAAADGPTAYGQQFVAVGRDWQDAAPPPVEVSSSSLSAADRKAFEVELDEGYYLETDRVPTGVDVVCLDNGMFDVSNVPRVVDSELLPYLLGIEPYQIP